MKQISLPAHLFRPLHWVAGVILGSMVLGFSISTPLVSQPHLPPSVKAAYTSAPLLPKPEPISAPTLSAKAIYIIDLESSTTLLAKNPHHRLRPASLTKIMTALVSLDNYDLGTEVEVKNGDLSIGAKAELLSGDLFSVEDMLFALLIPSGNDAAVTLAENYPGGYQKFIEQMNLKAQSLGLANTHFSNVSGVDTQNHFTSAYDMSLIAREALKRPMIKNIVATSKITLKSEKGNSYPLITTNILLGKPGVLGVKTGWTPEAGECLVTFVNRNNHPILISLLGSDDRFGETESLIDWVYTAFSWE